MDETRRLPSDVRRLAIGVRGVVQGVGFRPFVYGAARARGLIGWVRNDADAVRIEVQGDAGELAAFCDALDSAAPPQARVDAVDVTETACLPGARGFEIRPSDGAVPPRPTVPADLATCGECLAEICSASERRFRYPFTNCTNCGPRWSIIERLPYDRARTSMAGFSMCGACRQQYEDPADRRFHAQPIACPACGPRLQLVDPHGHETADGDDALRAAARAVASGKILALKGLGGFQLVVDATDAGAVWRLRERKQRPAKPFAVMVRSVDEARARCELSEEERRAIASHEAPILLLRRRGDPGATGDVADGVAPGNPYLGVMLPYTPLHHLLLDALERPIVCTSGNLAEEPMAVETDEALERLGGIADLFLVHDRPIVRPVDDSVARVGAGGFQLLRRARGYAPLPIDLEPDTPIVLAVGGHLKNTVAVAIGSQAVVSPHVGDLDNVLSVEVHRRAVRDLVDFFGTQPEAVACDLHPDYASTREAERLAAEWNVPLVRVQHHHAHVAACMAEHGLEGPVLGFAWDGTGYGTDGTVWGGEVLECEGAEFRRVAHLRNFALPGGDLAVREPRRSALGMLFEIYGAGAVKHLGGQFERSELEVLLAMLGRSVRCPRTSSMGRLFDAVAAVCGVLGGREGDTVAGQEGDSPDFAAQNPGQSPGRCSFEGQAAMALEFAAEWGGEEAYPLPLVVGGRGGEELHGGAEGDSPGFAAQNSGQSPAGQSPVVVDWEPMVRAVVADRGDGVSVGKISAKLHNALAEMAVAVVRHWGGRRVVLSGGCFQNALLVARVHGRLSAEGFEVYTHKRVPPGDGGISLGQLAIAARRMKEA